jgi:hypothetical protein
VVSFTPVIKAFCESIKHRLEQVFDVVIDDLFLETLRETEDVDIIRRAVKRRIDRNRYVFEIGGFTFHRKGFGRVGVLKKAAEAAKGEGE